MREEIICECMSNQRLCFASLNEKIILLYSSDCMCCDYVENVSSEVHHQKYFDVESTI